MKRNRLSQFGAINPRIFAAFLLCAVGAFLALRSFATIPDSGTITPANPKVTRTAGPFFVSNASPLPEVDAGPRCNGTPAQPCDDFIVTVTLPAGYKTTYPNASIKVTQSWIDTGTTESDYDLFIYKTPRADCSPNNCTVTNGGQAADFQSTGSAPGIVEIASFPAEEGTHSYTVVTTPFTATGETVTVKAELMTGSGSSGSANFGSADPTVAGQPRYQNFYAPAGSAKSRSGEFNIGFNPKSGRIMTMNRGPIWRLTPPELLTPTQPECCEALWEDKSNAGTNFGLDPIL
jgi:hypothetical protein